MSQPLTFAFDTQPFTVLDLESSEERGGTSLSNSAEAQLALHLFNNLRSGTDGLSVNSRVAVVSSHHSLFADLSVFSIHSHHNNTISRSHLMLNRQHYYAVPSLIVLELGMNGF